MERLRKWKVCFYCTDKRNICRQCHWFAKFRRKAVVISQSLHMVDLTMALFAKFYVTRTLEHIKTLFN